MTHCKPDTYLTGLPFRRDFFSATCGVVPLATGSAGESPDSVWDIGVVLSLPINFSRLNLWYSITTKTWRLKQTRKKFFELRVEVGKVASHKILKLRSWTRLWELRTNRSEAGSTEAINMLNVFYQWISVTSSSYGEDEGVCLMKYIEGVCLMKKNFLQTHYTQKAHRVIVRAVTVFRAVHSVC